MITLSQLVQELQEGVYDPNIFKAIFLAGGPGSGKSYVVRRALGGEGMKVVDSDDAFERLIKDPRRPGGPLDPAIGITRAGARLVLENKGI